MEKELLSVAYDHYKDTCRITEQAIKRRDRLMLFVVITLAFFAFQSVFPSASDTAVNDFLNFKFGLTLKLNFSIIGNIVWFLLLTFTIRYFQVSVFIERQHKYTHNLEERLEKGMGDDYISREGKSYKENYRLFSNWLWFLYTLIFPILLLLVGAVKIFHELINVCSIGWTFGLVLNFTLFILLAVSIVLYLIVIHKKYHKKANK